MNEKLYLKNGQLKVLTVDGLHPMYSDHCCCQEPVLTGKWFADIFEYYPKSTLRLNGSQLPRGEYKHPTIQLDDPTLMQTNFPNYRPSAIPVYQPYFYNASIRSTFGLNDPRLGLAYRTRLLTISGNQFVYDQQLYKNYGDWVHPEEEGSIQIVSGNTNSDVTSSVVYNYSLSTITTPVSFNQTFGSGFLSTFILNNTDNEYTQDIFVEASSLIEYSTKNNPNDSYFYPTITASYEEDNTEYVDQYTPLNEKIYTDTQIYINRIFKGSQEGFLFDKTSPNQFFDDTLYSIVSNVNDAPIIGSEDYQPLTGRTFYFSYHVTESDSPLGWRYVVKKDNKYYRYSTYDDKTILQVPSSIVISGTTNQPPNVALPDQVIESGIVSPNIITALVKNVYQVTLTYDQPQIIKVTSGLWGFDQNEYMSQEALSTISDGVVTYSELYDWYNHQTTPGQGWDDSVLIINPTTNLPQTGQCMLVGTEYWFPDDAQESYYDEDTGITTYYYWYYSLGFFRDYDSVTSTATMQMYKFGYNSNTGEYITGYFDTPKTVVINVSGYNQQTGEYDKVTNWDSTDHYFYYNEGSTQNYYPGYQDLYFQMNEWVTQFQPRESGMVRYYIYKAPKWGALLSVDRQYLIIDKDYIVTGASYDSLRAYDMNNYYDEMTILTGWWTEVYDHGYHNALVTSGQNYWYATDNYNNKTIPLTGGTYLDPQKSIAADDPDRPPYWWNEDGRSTPSIMSGRYFTPNDNIPRVLVPIYYDSQYGHIINHLYTNNYVPANFAAILQPVIWNPAYFLAKDMINKHSFQYLNPLFRFEIIKRHYDSNQGGVQQNPTIAQYFTPDFIDEGYQISGDIVKSHYLYEYWSSYVQNNAEQWGGSGQDSGSNTDIEYTTCTFRFVIPTPQQIAELNLTYEDYINPNDLVNFGLYDSIYCQVLTGFWIRKKDDNDERCGIRKHGFVHMNITPSYEYKLGYDLSNIADLNAQLSQDTSICYTKSGNQIVATHVNDYWSSVSAKLQSTSHIQDFNLTDFWSVAYVRPISGNINIQVQP